MNDNPHRDENENQPPTLADRVQHAITHVVKLLAMHHIFIEVQITASSLYPDAVEIHLEEENMETVFGLIGGLPMIDRIVTTMAVRQLILLGDHVNGPTCDIETAGNHADQLCELDSLRSYIAFERVTSGRLGIISRWFPRLS